MKGAAHFAPESAGEVGADEQAFDADGEAKGKAQGVGSAEIEETLHGCVCKSI